MCVTSVQSSKSYLWLYFPDDRGGWVSLPLCLSQCPHLKPHRWEKQGVKCFSHPSKTLKIQWRQNKSLYPNFIQFSQLLFQCHAFLWEGSHVQLSQYLAEMFAPLGNDCCACQGYSEQWQHHSNTWPARKVWTQAINYTVGLFCGIKRIIIF